MPQFEPGNPNTPLLVRKLEPGEIVLYCNEPYTGRGYTYTIFCKPANTIRELKQMILDPDPFQSKKFKPERPKMHIDEMFLRVGSLGVLDDDSTLESHGIGVGEHNDWISKQWIDILEI